MPGDVQIIERVLDAIDFLIRLVALAGDKHDIAGLRIAQRRGDRSGAVALHDGCLRMRESGNDLCDDDVAILAARIVVGDDNAIRESLRNRSHLRSLALIALAAAAEHADKLASTMRAQAGQCLFQCVWSVCVVDHDEWRTGTAAEAVHASVHRLQLLQRALYLYKRIPERAETASDGEQVVDVETPKQRRLYRAFAPWLDA